MDNISAICATSTERIKSVGIEKGRGYLRVVEEKIQFGKLRLQMHCNYEAAQKKQTLRYGEA